jgi:hypothetical protein
MSVNITLLSQEQFLSTHHVHVDMTIANATSRKVPEVHSIFGSRMIMTRMWQWSRSLTLSVVLAWHRTSSHKHPSRSLWHLNSWDWSDLFI